MLVKRSWACCCENWKGMTSLSDCCSLCKTCDSVEELAGWRMGRMSDGDIVVTVRGDATKECGWTYMSAVTALAWWVVLLTAPPGTEYGTVTWGQRILFCQHFQKTCIPMSSFVLICFYPKSTASNSFKRLDLSFDSSCRLVAVRLNIKQCLWKWC